MWTKSTNIWDNRRTSSFTTSEKRVCTHGASATASKYFNLAVKQNMFVWSSTNRLHVYQRLRELINDMCPLVPQNIYLVLWHQSSCENPSQFSYFTNQSWCRDIFCKLPKSFSICAQLNWVDEFIDFIWYSIYSMYVFL